MEFLLRDLRFDGAVFLFTLGSTLITGLLFGLAPVLRLAGTDIQKALPQGSKSSTSGWGRERLRGLLVVTEIGLAVMLVVGAALVAMVATYIPALRAARIDPVLTLQGGGR